MKKFVVRKKHNLLRLRFTESITLYLTRLIPNTFLISTYYKFHLFFYWLFIGLKLFLNQPIFLKYAFVVGNFAPPVSFKVANQRLLFDIDGKYNCRYIIKVRNRRNLKVLLCICDKFGIFKGIIEMFPITYVLLTSSVIRVFPVRISKLCARKISKTY